MNYLVIENGIITNIIVSDETFAASIGAKPWYDGAEIGAAYDPPTLNKLQSATTDLAEMTCNMLYEIDKMKLGVTE